MSDKKPGFGEFCWNELMTPDAKIAKEFYTSLFGWKTQEHDMGNGTYTMYMKDDDFVGGGMMQIPADQKGQIPPHWMSYISVENVAATVAKAQALGGTIKVPVTPVVGFGSFALIVDPTGAIVGLWQSEKKC